MRIHRYNDKVPFMFILEAGMGCAFLGEGIANQILVGGLPYMYISSITASAFLLVTTLSMIVCYPFTIQFSRIIVKPEIVATWGFVIFNQALTSIWVLIFAIMTACAWVGHIYFGSNSNSTGYIILNIIVPIALPLVGGFLMKPISQCLIARVDARKNAQGGGDGNTQNEDIPVAKIAV
jgi:hypothetical protein